MKASQFIKVALIDKMQVIADAGLWYHLSKLIPSGVEVLARTWAGGNNLVQGGHIFLPMTVDIIVERFYLAHGPEYVGKYPIGSSFFSGTIVKRVMCSDKNSQHLHLAEIDGIPHIHVPTWFSDFKEWCIAVLVGIESEDIEDIDIFKTFDQ